MTVEDYRLLEGAATTLRASVIILRRMLENGVSGSICDNTHRLLVCNELAYQAVSQVTRSARITAIAISNGGETA